jgi:hypothetical protein
MVNLILLKHKTLGSAALRCGASSFGLKECGNFSGYPTQFVVIFKSKKAQLKFRRFLADSGVKFQDDYYYKHVYYKSEFLYLVFTSFYQFNVSNKRKLYFRNFRQLCNTSLIQHYSSNRKNPHSY